MNEVEFYIIISFLHVLSFIIIGLVLKFVFNKSVTLKIIFVYIIAWVIGLLLYIYWSGIISLYYCFACDPNVAIIKLLVMLTLFILAMFFFDFIALDIGKWIYDMRRKKQK